MLQPRPQHYQKNLLAKLLPVGISTILFLWSLSPAPPADVRYDDDMKAHPNWDIRDIGTQDQSKARNNADNEVIKTGVTENVCPQVMGMGYLSDKRMVVVTQWCQEHDYTKISDQLFSRLYVYTDHIFKDSIGAVKGRQISDLIFETSSLLILNDTVWLAQKDQLVYFPWSLAQKKIEEGGYLTQPDLTVVGPKIPKTMPGGYANGHYNFQEYPLGLLHREAKFYIVNSGTVHHGGKSPNIDVFKTGYKAPSGVGGFISIDRKTGKMDVITTGLRANNALGWGLGRGPDGENWGLYSGLYTIDNQGCWKPGSPVIHLKRNEWHWYPRPKDDVWGDKPADVAVWLPHGQIGRSPTDCRTFTKGIFAGQLLFGDVAQGGLKRCFLEDVKGQMQGSAHSFSGGFSAGPNRVLIEDWNDNAVVLGHIGNGVFQNWGWRMTFCGFQKMMPKKGSQTAFEMLAVRSRKNGFEIEFTRALSAGGAKTSSFSVERYIQKPDRSYGGGSMKDRKKVTIKNARVSPDKKKVFLEIDIPGQIFKNSGNKHTLEKNTVVQITCNENGVESDGQSPRTPRAWYTLNKVSDSEPFPKRGCKNDFYKEYDSTAVDMDVLACKTPKGATATLRSRTGAEEYVTNNGPVLNFPSPGPHAFTVYNVRGNRLLSLSGQGRKQYNLSHRLKSGIYFVTVITDKGRFTGKKVIY